VRTEGFKFGNDRNSEMPLCYTKTTNIIKFNTGGIIGLRDVLVLTTNPSKTICDDMYVIELHY